MDLRVDKERAVSERTPFQYHGALQGGVQYVHFPITDRSTPTKRTADQFARLVRTIAENTGPVYIRCRGGHGRSGLAAACVLVQSGTPPDTALATVRASHATRPGLTRRMRTLGAPQNDKQRGFVWEYGGGGGGGTADSTGPVNFYDERKSVFSNLWGTKGTFRHRTLGGEHHLDGLHTPLLPDKHQRWRTVEHFYQANKFLWDEHLPGATPEIIKAGWEYARLIAGAATGATVFRLGNIGHPDRRRWLKSGYEANYRIDPSVEGSPLINDGRVHVRPDWDKFRKVVMDKALCVKFHAGQPRSQLADTGDRPIHEHTRRDLYWGDGMEDVNGQDMLGQRLQAIRRANAAVMETEMGGS